MGVCACVFVCIMRGGQLIADRLNLYLTGGGLVLVSCVVSDPTHAPDLTCRSHRATATALIN